MRGQCFVGDCDSVEAVVIKTFYGAELIKWSPVCQLMCDKILEQAQNIWACVKLFHVDITTGGFNRRSSTRFGGIVDFFVSDGVSTESSAEQPVNLSPAPTGDATSAASNKAC